MPRAKRLSCGGKGPCCHVGYSHRHCEHCDTVIDTRAGWWPYNPPTWPYRPWGGTWSGTGSQQSPLWSGTGVQIGNDPRTQLMNTATLDQPALSEHTCEVAP